MLEDFINRREQIQQGTLTPLDVVGGLSQNFNPHAQKAGVNMNNMNQVIKIITAYF
jgi:hypothetical protein